jgi:hypothetical protein
MASSQELSDGQTLRFECKNRRQFARAFIRAQLFEQPPAFVCLPGQKAARHA